MHPQQRILIIQGHPDPAGGHFGHALAEAYASGACAAGHEVRVIDVAALDFPLLRTKHAWEQGALPPALLPAQQGVQWAQHLVFFFPLWLGGMPALLKGFLEQVARPGFALALPGTPGPRQLLKGRSARVVVTMGMPAPLYRWFFAAHDVKALERNILGFVGISPVRRSLIGMVEGDAKRRLAWLQRLRSLGEKAS
ncbi:NAD(P)H-dependent oxidoreductase [Ideonella azotifigens]|nr:NAD(P)H-dependent oxidoreductase [Ideonella azotifigens]MCD2339949.1 NAD(P)H-dependent oxidoreductase [Ideonella azotifigens]